MRGVCRNTDSDHLKWRFDEMTRICDKLSLEIIWEFDV
jgi:hypothetical protein